MTDDKDTIEVFDDEDAEDALTPTNDEVEEPA